MTPADLFPFIPWAFGLLAIVLLCIGVYSDLDRWLDDLATRRRLRAEEDRAREVEWLESAWTAEDRWQR